MSKANTPQVIGELIEDRAGRNGDRIFLRFKDQSFTYNEINRYANRCANAFINQGVEKGDKISIMLPNCPEFLHLWFGSAKIGAVEVPINTSYKGEFLRHAKAEQVQVEVLFTFKVLIKAALGDSRSPDNL